MTSSILQKECAGCQQTKPISAYYKRSQYDGTQPGHYVSECKSCMKARSKKQKRGNKLTPRSPTEILAIKYLLKNGFYALPGKAVSYADVDIVVFGFVRVEVKYGLWRNVGSGSSHFVFSTTEKQRERGFLADIVMLICPWETAEPTFHIFRPDTKLFVNEETGQLKHGIYYRPGSVEPQRAWVSDEYYLSEADMRVAQDAFGLIHQVMKELAADFYKIPDKWELE